MEEVTYLCKMHESATTLSKEATWRKKANETISVSRGFAQEYFDKGFGISKELVRKIVVSKEWSHDKQLENKVWMLFYKLGYPEISEGYEFKVRIEKKGVNPLYKQIDVLAKDDETVVVAECKSSQKPSRRSLQKDIEEFANLKGSIANAINKHYSKNGKKLKIIWLIVTSNIIWSTQDRIRAIGEKISIVTEKELRYYFQIAEHLRAAGRYQFLAEFLKDQRIPGMEKVTVPAIKGKLGGRPFYSFISTPRQMLKIAFVNHRSLNDPEGAPSYQRLVSKTRLTQISKFLGDGGYFPTNILVNFSQRCQFDLMAKDESADVTFGKLHLPSKYRSAWVIDGQHRLYGYASLSDKYLDQNIMVVAFENLSKTEEANLFVTINHEQKSVAKTLLDELEGELKWGSSKPGERIGAISSRLISILNEDVGEALYRRVTQQGIAATDRTCLTVPEFKNGIRKSKLIGSSISGGREYSPGPFSGVTDSDTLDRARQILNGYFDELRSANSALWEAGRKGFICTNMGIQGFLLLLGSLIEYMESKTTLTARELEPLDLLLSFEEYLNPVLAWLKKATNETMSAEFKVVYGSGGPLEYYMKLCNIVHDSYPGFSPDGYKEWVEGRSAERIELADKKIKEINIIVQKSIFDKLKKVYGSLNDAYWREGVKDKNIMTNAYSKSLADSSGLPLENYLEFIEYKKIIERKENWVYFKDIFDIPEPGEKGKAKNLKWMERINELRRIQAHPTENRSYTPDDFDYIDRIYDVLNSRITCDEEAIAQ